MDAVVHTDLASFDALTHNRLAADPVRNTIALTSLDRVRRLPGNEQQPTLVTFHDRGEGSGGETGSPIAQRAGTPDRWEAPEPCTTTEPSSAP